MKDEDKLGAILAQLRWLKLPGMARQLEALLTRALRCGVWHLIPRALAATRRRHPPPPPPFPVRLPRISHRQRAEHLVRAPLRGARHPTVRCGEVLVRHGPM